jgi:hypothetical protein
MHHYIVAFDIEQLGSGSLLRLPHRDVLACQHVTDLAGGIVHVPGDDGMFRANDDAGRLQANICTVGAVMALGGRAGIWIDVDGIVWTRLQARLAANANAPVEFDDAV